MRKSLGAMGPARKIHNLMAGAAVFILTAGLYLRTVGPTLGGGIDSAEYQHIAYTLGIAHPTGYPLYLVLGKIFTILFPIGNIAYRMNVLSALLGAGAAVFVYLDIVQLTGRRLVAVAGTAVFVVNVAMWRQSGVASAGPLQMLLLGALVYALLLWRARRLSLAWACLVFGLGLAHHRSILLLAPAIALFVLLVDFDLVRRPRDLARYAFCVALPLLFYLYIPIRGSSLPGFDNSPAAFIAHISGGEAGDYVRNNPIDLLDAAQELLNYFADSLGYLGVGLVIVGVLSAMPQRKRQGPGPEMNDTKTHLFLGLATLIYTGLAVLFGDERDRYFVLPFFFLLLWFAIGATILESQIRARIAPASIRRGTLAALFAGLALLVVLPFGDHYRAADWSSNYREYKQWDEIFTLPLPPGADVVGNWRQLNDMRYMQGVENRRTDLQLVGTMYDPTPQTRVAQELSAGHGSLFVAPGIPLPQGEYRYAMLGPLVQVRAAPQMSPPDSIPVPMHVALTPSLSLVGTGISVALEPYSRTGTATLAPGRTVRVAFYWRADGVLRDWLAQIRLYDPEGRVVAQVSEPPVHGLYNPSLWQPSEYVSDVHNFLIPGGLPPGEDQLTLAIVDPEAKTQIGNEIPIGRITIASTIDLPRDQVFIQHPLDLALDGRMAVAGYGGLDGVHRPGDKITPYLLWSVREKTGENLNINLALVDSAGNTWLAWRGAPVSFYPTSQWKPGEFLKAYYDLQLPGTLPPGPMTLRVGLTAQATVPIAKFEITP